MAYPGDFVVANRAARHAAINLFRKAKKPKHKLDHLRYICFRAWELLAKRTLPRIHSCGSRGQMNAVYAAFKAGIKPSQIARQFGIARSDVHKVLTERDT